VSFSLEIREIHEMSDSGVALPGYSFNEIDITAVENQTDAGLTWTYETTLDNGAQISFTFLMVNNATTMNFAGETFTLSPNALKTTVYISNWPFENLSHQLQIVTVVNASTEQGGGDDCSNFATNLDLSGNLQGFQYSINGQALVGTYIDSAVVDGATKPLRVSSLDNNRIAFTLSHFWQYEILDPDLSVIIDPLTGTCGNSALDTDVIAISVSLIGAALVVSAVGLLIFYRKRTNTMKRLSSRGSIQVLPLRSHERLH